jgi:hypothetical protein
VTWWPLGARDVLDSIDERPHCTAGEIALDWDEPVGRVNELLVQLELNDRIVGQGNGENRRYSRAPVRRLTPAPDALAASVEPDAHFDELDRMMRTNRGPV